MLAWEIPSAVPSGHMYGYPVPTGTKRRAQDADNSAPRKRRLTNNFHNESWGSTSDIGSSSCSNASDNTIWCKRGTLVDSTPATHAKRQRTVAVGHQLESTPLILQQRSAVAQPIPKQDRSLALHPPTCSNLTADITPPETPSPAAQLAKFSPEPSTSELQLSKYLPPVRYDKIDLSPELQQLLKDQLQSSTFHVLQPHHDPAAGALIVYDPQVTFSQEKLQHLAQQHAHLLRPQPVPTQCVIQELDDDDEGPLQPRVGQQWQQHQHQHSNPMPPQEAGWQPQGRQPMPLQARMQTQAQWPPQCTGEMPGSQAAPSASAGDDMEVDG